MDYDFYERLQRQRVLARGGTSQDVRRLEEERKRRFKSQNSRFAIQGEQENAKKYPNRRVVEPRKNESTRQTIGRGVIERQQERSAVEGVMNELAKPFVGLKDALSSTITDANSYDLNKNNYVLERSQADIQKRARAALKDRSLSSTERKRWQRLLDTQTKDQVETSNKAVQEAQEQTRVSNPKKVLGDIAQTASYGIAGGALRKALQTGGRSAVTREIAKSAAGGAIGGGGYEASNRPNSSALEMVRSGLIGGGVGAAIPVVGAGAGRAYRGTTKGLTESSVAQSISKTRAGKSVTDLKDKFVAKIVDDMNYVKKPFKGKVDEDLGISVGDKIDELTTNVRQFNALSQERLRNNQSFQQIRELIGGDKKRYEEFGEFIKQKQNAINNNKLVTSGADVGEGKALVDVPVGTPEQEQAYRLLNQSTKDDVQYLFDNGIIDEARYKEFMADPDYTRVQREIEDELVSGTGTSSMTLSKPVISQRLKGSEKEAVDPFAAYEDWQRRITLDVEKNNLDKYIRDQSLKNGITDVVDAPQGTIDRVRQLYGEEGVRQRTLPVFEDGVKQLYTIDPRAAKQLSGMADLELRAIADWVLAPSRVLRSGATSGNLAFAVPNFIRDQLYSAVVSDNALATHNPIRILGGIKEAMLKPVARNTVGKVAPRTSKLWEPSDAYKAWASRNENITRVDLARNLKSATMMAQQNLGIRGETPWRRYEDIISATEKAARYQNFMGTYQKALRDNIDPEKALELASRASRRNSINFSRRGEIAVFGKIFNPYFNAGVQGSARLARAFKDRPVPTALKTATGLLMPVAASTYYNLSDPERARLYAQIPDYERGSNLIMVLGGDRGYVKVPLPPGLMEFANPLRNFIESEYLGDRQGLLETAKNLFVDPFSPVGTTANQVLSTAIPQAIKPVVEIAMNRNIYTGRDIVPEDMRGLPANEQVFDSTPQIFRDIGSLTGISPLQVRKLTQGYVAGGGEGALTTIDQLRGANTGGRSTAEQLAARFYAPDVTNSQVDTKLFEAYEKLDQQKKNTTKKIFNKVKSGDTQGAYKLASELNQKVDKENERFRKTYGRYEQDSELLNILNSSKIELSDSYVNWIKNNVK